MIFFLQWNCLTSKKKSSEFSIVLLILCCCFCMRLEKIQPRHFPIDLLLRKKKHSIQIHLLWLCTVNDVISLWSKPFHSLTHIKVFDANDEMNEVSRGAPKSAKNQNLKRKKHQTITILLVGNFIVGVPEFVLWTKAQKRCEFQTFFEHLFLFLFLLILWSCTSIQKYEYRIETKLLFEPIEIWMEEFGSNIQVQIVARKEPMNDWNFELWRIAWKF